jgi:hypothetical protein
VSRIVLDLENFANPGDLFPRNEYHGFWIIGKQAKVPHARLYALGLHLEDYEIVVHIVCRFEHRVDHTKACATIVNIQEQAVSSHLKHNSTDAYTEQPSMHLVSRGDSGTISHEVPERII